MTGFSNRTCGECAYHMAQSDHPDEAGSCRRYPPVPMLVQQQKQTVTPGGPQMQTGFTVNAFFLLTMNRIPACGEFMPDEGCAVQ